MRKKNNEIVTRKKPKKKRRQENYKTCLRFGVWKAKVQT